MPTTTTHKEIIHDHTDRPIEVIVQTGEAQVKGFVNFLRTQGVMGLAVGIVLGGAVTVLAKSLIDNILTPPLGLLLGSANGLKGLTVNIGRAADGGEAVLHYGQFLNDTINFFLIALVVYIVFSVLGLQKVDVPKVAVKKK